MKKGYVNWTLVLVLVLGVCALGVTVIGLRKYNRTQRAEQGLERGLVAYEEERWSAAASGLGQYLGIHQTDVDILLKYGHAQSRIQPFRREHYAQAVNAYRNVLRLDEANVEAARSLVDLYLQANVPAEAELVASRFLEKGDDSNITVRLAAAQMMQRKYEDAAQLLTEVLTREPSETAVYELLAQVASERPNLLPKTPREWIDLAVANNPQKAQAHILRGRFLADSGQRDLAIQSLQQAEQCELSDQDVRLSLAAAWLRLDALEQAEAQLDALYASDPTLPQLWQLRAVAAAKRQDPAKAGEVARAGLEHLGDAKGVFLPYAAELFLQAGDNESARAALKGLRELDLNSGLVFYLDGLLAERDGDWSLAMTHWREAVVQGYTAEPVYLKLAEGAMRLEDRTSAIETLQRFLRQNPNSYSAHLMLARILAEGRQWAAASESAASAARLSPTSREAQSLLMRTQIERLAQQPQSAGRVDQILAELLAADDSLQHRLLAFRIALSRQDWTKAQQALEAINERFGPSLSLQMAWAEYYAIRQQTEQSAALLREAMAAYPDASEPVILLASLYLDQNKSPEALSILQEAASRLEGPPLRRVRLLMGDIYNRSGQTQDAVAVFTAMAADYPQDILSRRQLLTLRRNEADAAWLAEQIDAIKKIEGAAGRIWKIEQVSLWLAQGEIEQHYSQAVSLLNENLAANPDDKQSVMLLAAAHEQAGNMRLSMSLYQDTLVRHPDDVDLAIAAMGAMYRAQETRQAEQLLADLLAAGHTDPRLAQFELQSHLRQGRLDSAEEMLEKMILRNADDDSAKLSLAMLRTRSGQFDAARQLIDDLISENPDAVVYQAALTDWHLQQKQPEQAMAVVEAFLRRHDTVEVHRLRCQVLLAMGQTDDAVAGIGTILERAGSDPEVLLNVSELYIAAGREAQALDAAQKALALAPDSFDAQKQTALLLLAQTQTQQEGAALLEKAIAKQPNDVQLRLRKAALLLSRIGGTPDDGIQILSVLVNDYPRLEPAWGYLIEWYLLNNQPGMAMDTVLRGLAAIPESRLLAIAKARVESLRSPSVALETLNRLAQQYPSDEEIVQMRALMMQRADRNGQAVQLLGDWLASGSASESISLRLLYMELLYADKQIEPAKQLYERLSADPKVADTALIRWLSVMAETAGAEEMAAAFERWYQSHPQGGPMALQILQTLLANQSPSTVSAARQILTLVLGREPNSPEAVFAMAMLHHMTGQKLESVPYYERTLELQPENVVAINNLAWILSQDKFDHRRALQLADNGLAQAPDYVDLIDTRGTIHFAMEQYDKAAEDFRKAAAAYLDSQPQKTVSTFYLAQCLLRLGSNEPARNEFFRARELDDKVGGLTPQQRAELAEILR
ncbi:MAG: tetratricopeptide repeat protein [Phycisphaerae bacterium]|nr:tetratricopeptide repeat protein [Phycisphaerae bacterium]